MKKNERIKILKAAIKKVEADHQKEIDNAAVLLNDLRLVEEYAKDSAFWSIAHEAFISANNRAAELYRTLEMRRYLLALIEAK